MKPAASPASTPPRSPPASPPSPRLDDNADRARMTQACVTRAKRFDFAATAAQFRALYDELAQAGR